MTFYKYRNHIYYRSKYRYNNFSKYFLILLIHLFFILFILNFIIIIIISYVTNDGGSYNSNQSGNRTGSNKNSVNSLFSGPGYTLVDLPPVSENRSTAQAIADREAAKKAAIERYKKISASEENNSSLV